MAEKIDVLDFVINILKEHEVKMDEYVSRLEGIVEVLTENSLTFSRTVTRKGGGLGVAIPKEVRAMLDLGYGDVVEVTIRKKEFSES